MKKLSKRNNRFYINIFQKKNQVSKQKLLLYEIKFRKKFQKIKF